MGQIQTLEDLLGMLRRRALVILPIVVLGLALSLGYALQMPRSYEAAAVIQVETPSISGETGPIAGGPNAAQRLQLIEQRLMARDAVLQLIERHGLFDDLPGLTALQKVTLFRGLVRLENIAAGPLSQSRDGVSALVVIAALGDPVQAADVANDLADRILSQNSRTEDLRLRETERFFSAEAARLSDAIAALEAEATRFKNANVDALPGAETARNDELIRLAEQRREIDRQLLTLNRDRSALAAETPPRTVTQRQIALIDGQIAVLDEQRAALVARETAVQESIRRAPGVETELGNLDRALRQLQEQFGVATRSLAEAETAIRLSQSEQGDRFEVIERAVPPDFPASSGRRRAMVFGAAASVALALAAALLLEMRNPVIRTSGQMQRSVGITPVIAIPFIETEAEERQRRLVRIVGLAAAVAALAIGMGVLGTVAGI
jgi:uncharacterized protein involved in exopolysaccharide biosynthesis